MTEVKRILFVGNEPDAVKPAGRRLGALPGIGSCEVEGFADPVKALARAREQQFDVVIADYQTPEIGGLEFLKAFSRIQPDCPQLVMSGGADMHALRRIFSETRVFRFVPQPCPPSTLDHLIALAIEHAAMLAKGKRRVIPRPTPTTLRSNPLLAELPERELEELAAVANWKAYEPGNAIVTQNDRSSAVHFVVSGFVKVVRGSNPPQSAPAPVMIERRKRSRHDVMVAMLGPGDMVGEVAALLSIGRSASVFALTPCQVIDIPCVNFLFCMQTQPKFALAVARNTARRLIDASRQIELMRGDLEGRIHALMRHCRALGLDIERWLTIAEIARMVGATRVAVSQIITRISAKAADPLAKGRASKLQSLGNQ